MLMNKNIFSQKLFHVLSAFVSFFTLYNEHLSTSLLKWKLITVLVLETRLIVTHTILDYKSQAVYLYQRMELATKANCDLL